MTPDDDSADIFVYHSTIKMDGFRSLDDNEIVEFVYQISNKGRKAVTVTGPNGGKCRGRKWKRSRDGKGYCAKVATLTQSVGRALSFELHQTVVSSESHPSQPADVEVASPGEVVPGCSGDDLPAGTRVTQKSARLQDAQQSDPDISRVLQLKLTQSRRLSRRQAGKESAMVKKLLHSWKRLAVKDDLLVYRKGEDGRRFLLVLPKAMRIQILQHIHDSMGHMGLEKTLQHAKDRYFWPEMHPEIRSYIDYCRRCSLKKVPTPTPPFSSFTVAEDSNEFRRRECGMAT